MTDFEKYQDVVNKTINFLTFGIEIPCFGDNSHCPNEKVLTSYYNLRDQYCYDGRAFFCDGVHCNGEYSEDMCCTVQKLLKQLKDLSTILASATTHMYDTTTTPDCLSAVTTAPSYGIIAVLGILLLLSFFANCYLLHGRSKTKKELQKVISESRQKRKTQIDGTEGCYDSGVDESSQFSSLETNRGLATSNGSLDKKKIHANPIEQDTDIKPGKDQRHQYHFGRPENYQMLPVEDNGDSDELHTTTVLK